jgi:hypothetical protein
MPYHLCCPLWVFLLQISLPLLLLVRFFLFSNVVFTFHACESSGFFAYKHVENSGFFWSFDCVSDQLTTERKLINYLVFLLYAQLLFHHC